MHVLLYCGSRSGDLEVYSSAAEAFALQMIKRELGLVYGGGSVGLMGTAARTMTRSNGHVIGVIPRFLARDEVMYRDCSELIEVESMHVRKLTMIERCDMIVAMAGAYGTMDELFEAVTWLQLGLHDKPIGLLNTNGYYDHLVSQFDVMVKHGFLTERNRNLIFIEEDPGRLLDHLLERASTGTSSRLESRS
jgi:uncharacterized protein (TIGR00730 family)